MARKPRITLYDLLDASPFASADELRTAYRRAAREFHPDTANEAAASGRSANMDKVYRESLMKELNEAWDTLGDVAARAEYDAMIGLRRPGAFAVGLRGLRARIFRHRPAWRLKVMRPDAPDTSGLRRMTASVRDALWATRLGQWLTIAVIALAWQLPGAIPSQARAVLALVSVSVAAVILARGGEPTPLTDALGVMRTVVAIAWGLLRHVGSRGGHALVAATVSASPAPGSDRRPRAAQASPEADDAWLAEPAPGPDRRPPLRPGARPTRRR